MEYSLNPFMWYNFIFAAPAFVALFYMAIMIISGLSEDFGPDVEEPELSGEVESDTADSELDEGHHLGFGDSFLSLLNLRNRCPKTFAFALLFLVWGASGYLINTQLLRFARFMFSILVIGNIAISATVSILIVRLIAPLVAKSMPSGTVSISKADFVDRRAKVSTMLVPGKIGQIVMDTGEGSPVIGWAKLAPSYEGPSLKANEEVLILRYDKEMYVVVPVQSLDKIKGSV